MSTLSVVTVSYNSEKTIARTFESIASQRNQTFEYVVVDGNSKDLTQHIISSNDRIDKLCIEDDQGVYDALNKGIRLTTGDYILILHSNDEFIDDNVISTIFESLNKANSDIHLFSVIAKGRIDRKIGIPKFSGYTVRFGFMPPHTGWIVKRSVFEKIGWYDTSFKICGDFEFWIRIMNSNLSFSTNKVFITEMSRGGLSTNGLTSYLAVTKEMIRALRKHKIKPFYLLLWLRGILKKVTQL